MPYIDSVFVTDEQEQAIKARAKKMNAAGVATFGEAAALLLMDGVQAMDEADAQQSGQVEPVQQQSADPLAAMTGG